MYTGVEDLFVVGCDVRGGYGESAKNADVASDKSPENADRILDGWKVAKTFVEEHYPCATVTVVRPVALKGLGFRELDNNPDY